VSSSWIIVIGTLGGVFITASAGLLTAYLSGHQRVAEAEHRSAKDREKQLWEERRTIYLEYLTTYRAMYSRAYAVVAQGGHPDLANVNSVLGNRWQQFEQVATEVVLDFSRCHFAVQISGSKQTREAVEKASATLWDLVEACVSGDQAAFQQADDKTRDSRRRLREMMRADLGIDLG
jgi:gas vesicle protein